MAINQERLYQYVNVGIGDIPQQDDRLYQYTNIVAGAPCPWVNGTNLEVATQNQPLTIFGRGFQPGALDTGPEARAHETDDPGSPYVVMGALTAWTDTEVTVTVPPGVGNPIYIRVVHTGPDATALCTGSNLVYQMVAPFSPVPIDPDAGWWIEAWDLDNASPLVRGIPALNAPWQKVLNDVGDGSITLPAPNPDDPDAFSRHRELCDPPNDVSTLLKIYMDGRYQYSFWADLISDPYDEPAGKVVDISGRGIESILDWARLFPYDYDPADPLKPTLSPDWNYGYSLSYFESFDVDPPKDPEWEPRNGGLESAITPGEVIVTPDGVHSGLQRTYEVEAGSKVRWYMEVLGSVDGMRVTAGMAFGETADSVESANTFLYNGEYLSELGNVPSTGTGCPGGSTDTAVWKTVEVELTLPEDVNSITVFIQADHHASCGAPGNQPFTIRNVSLTAAGVGVPTGWASFNADIFTVVAGQGIDGTYALQIAGDTTGNSTWADTPATTFDPGIPTTIFAEVNTSEDWQIEIIDPEDGTTIWATSPLFSGIGAYQLGSFEWIPPVGTTTGIVRIVWPLGQGSIAGYIDNVGVATGLAPTTPGEIVRDMVEAGQARGAITQVELDFTDSNDSDGNLWTRVVAINFGHGQTILEAIGQIVAQGFEFEVAPRFASIGGDVSIVLSLYNGRSQGPSYGVGDNQELTRPDDAVTIREGQIMAPGESTQSIPRNTTFAEGADDPETGGTLVTQATDDDAVTGLGRREDFFTNAQLLDLQTLTDTAQVRLFNLRKASTSATIELLQGSPYLPGVDYQLGDTIQVDLGEQIPEDWYRVARIGCELGDGDQSIRWVTDIGHVQVPEDATIAVTLSRLLDLQQNTVTPGTGQSTDTTSGVPGATVVIPGSTVAPHTHPYGEIQPGGLSGDLAGSNPQPLVAGIRGKPITTDGPTDRDVLAYDQDAVTWALGRRMNWLNAWPDDGTTYEASDVVRAGAWTMAANKETTDDPAPQPVGPADWLLDEAPAWTSTVVNDVVVSGIRVSNLTTAYYAEAVRVWISSTAANSVYQLVIQDNNTGALSIESPFVGTDVEEVGWFLIGRPVYMLPGDDFSFLLIQHSNVPLTPTVEPWTWTGFTNSQADPGVGNVNGKTNGNILRINDTDDNSVDQSTLLAGVTAGTVITITQQSDGTKSVQYLVALAEDDTSHYVYAATLAQEGAGGPPDDDALCDVSFANPTLDPQTVVELPAHWAGSSVLQGEYAEGGNPLVADTNAYGVDLHAQQFTASPDWDLVAVSTAAAAFGGGGGAGGGHQIQDDGTPLPQQPALDFVGFNVFDDGSNSATVVESVAQGGPVRMSKAFLDSDFALGLGWFKIPATALHPDAQEDWRDGSGGLIAPVDGIYVVSGQIPFQDYNAADFPIAILSTNGIPPAAGAAYIGWIQRLGLITPSSTLPFARVFYLNAGDVVQMNANDANTGGNVRGEPIAADAYNAATLELTLLEVDADGLEISGKIDLSVDTALLSVGANHVIPFDRALIDIGGITNLGINGFTVPAGFGGTYVLNVNPQVGTGPGGGPIDDTRVEVLVNGLTAGGFAGRGRVQGRDFSQTQTAPVMLQLAAGDQVTFTHFIGAGAPYSLRGNASPISATKCEAWLFRLTGASTIPDDLTYLRLDGTNAMAGDLDMGDNDIVDLANDPLPYSQQIIAAPAGWLGDIVVTQSGRTLQLLVRMIRTTDVTINGPLNLVTTTLQPNNATYFVCATSQYNTQIRTPSSASLVWQTDGKVTLINRIVGANALRGEAIGMLDVNMQ